MKRVATIYIYNQNASDPTKLNKDWHWEMNGKTLTVRSLKVKYKTLATCLQAAIRDTERLGFRIDKIVKTDTDSKKLRIVSEILRHETRKK